MGDDYRVGVARAFERVRYWKQGAGEREVHRYIQEEITELEAYGDTLPTYMRGQLDAYRRLAHKKATR